METPVFSDLPSDEWSERGEANKMGCHGVRWRPEGGLVSKAAGTI